MNTLGWWMVLSPMAVMVLGVRVVRYRGRYRGRRRNDSGVGIFQPPELPAYCPSPVVPVIRADAILSAEQARVVAESALRRLDEGLLTHSVTVLADPVLPDRAVIEKVSATERRYGDYTVHYGIAPGALVVPRLMLNHGWVVQWDGDRLRATRAGDDIIAMMIPMP